MYESESENAAFLSWLLRMLRRLLDMFRQVGEDETVEGDCAADSGQVTAS